jgi:NADH-quinone oxidoreductase subunit H
VSTTAILVASIAKILFVLLVVVGAFAPMLVWAERRQSAMMQDRVGPHRAGIPLPKGVLAMIDGLRSPLRAGAYLSWLGMFLAVALLGILLLFREEPVLFGLAAETYYIAIPLLGVAGLLLMGGYKVHTKIIEGGGTITLIGLLHPAADAVKLIWKEDFVPPKADKFLFSIAPIISLIPAIAAFAVIPFADVLYLDYWDQHIPFSTELATLGSAQVPMQIASLNVGILFIFAVAGTGIIGAAVGGYASDNKYSLIGGIRAASQMVSYEVALGLTIVPCFMLYGSLRLEEMAAYQSEHFWGILYPPLWIPFVLYLTCSIAETKRIPFDAPEGESELVGGYLTEYSGMKFGMFFTSEFVEVVVLSALASILFFGGWDVPFLTHGGFDLPFDWEIAIPGTNWVFADQIPMVHWGVIAVQVVAFLVKIVVFIWLQLMVRWSLPRFRYDQIMALCWKGILPLALINILIMALFILATS